MMMIMIIITYLSSTENAGEGEFPRPRVPPQRGSPGHLLAPREAPHGQLPSGPHPRHACVGCGRGDVCRGELQLAQGASGWGGGGGGSVRDLSWGDERRQHPGAAVWTHLPCTCECEQSSVFKCCSIGCIHMAHLIWFSALDTSSMHMWVWTRLCNTFECCSIGCIHMAQLIWYFAMWTCECEQDCIQVLLFRVYSHCRINLMFFNVDTFRAHVSLNKALYLKDNLSHNTYQIYVKPHLKNTQDSRMSNFRWEGTRISPSLFWIFGCQTVLASAWRQPVKCPRFSWNLWRFSRTMAKPSLTE